MRTWSFISQKGGSGKSTLSTQLAVYAMECGEKSIIFDMDPQGSAEVWHDRRGRDRHPGAIRVLPEKLQLAMGGAEQLGHTLLLIDTAPHTNKDVLPAIRAADLIICPTQASLFDLASLEDTATVLRADDAMDRAIVVVNCVAYSKGGTETYEQAVVAAHQLGFKRVAQNFICHRRPFVISTNKGMAVTETHPKDESAAELRRLWLELVALTPMASPAKETAR